MTCGERSCSPGVPEVLLALTPKLEVCSRCCSWGAEVWIPNPCHSISLKKGLQIHLAREKTPVLTFSFAKRCKNYLKGKKKKVNFAVDQLQEKLGWEQSWQQYAPTGWG